MPSQYPHIQDAINAAADGDTIQVAGGTYLENIDFLGKAIKVLGSGAATTILQGNGQTAVVSFHSNETSSSLLADFTIENGGASSSAASSPEGGVYINNASPGILENTFRGNACNAIAVVGGSPSIIRNTIHTSIDLGTTLCRATEDAHGVGSFDYGGIGIFIRAASPSGIPRTLIDQNTISGNIQGSGAGAILAMAGNWIAENNTITGNAAGTGSALTAITSLGSFTFAQNLVYGNTSNDTGFYKAAIDIDDEASPAAINALSSYFVNNTIANNTVGAGFSYATDVYLGGSGAARVSFVNNIVSGGTNAYPALFCSPLTDQLVSDVLPAANNDIYNSNGGAPSAGICAPVAGMFGNINANPMLNSPPTGDYHLHNSSPAIDAGNNSYIINDPDDSGNNPLPADFDDETRVANGTIDMGAYEYQFGAASTPWTIAASASTYDISGPPFFLEAFVRNPTTVTSNLTGIVNFFANGKTLGSTAVSNSGIATLANPSLTPGAQEITATYDSAATGSLTSVPFFVMVEKYTPSLTLTASANNVPQGQPVTYTLKITAPDTNQLSPLYFYDQSGAVQLAALTPDATGTATYSTGALIQGVHPLTAYYPGDAAHNFARAALTETITAPTAITPTLSFTAVPAVSTLGDSVGLSFAETPIVPGTLAITDNGNSLITSQITSGAYTGSVSNFSIGVHTLIATFTPDNTVLDLPATSAPVTITVNAKPAPVTTSTTLSANATTIAFGGSITLAASVTPAAAAGSFAITDNGAQFLSLPAMSGSLSYTVPNPSVGTHIFVASFVPTDPAAYTASTSAVVTVVVSPTVPVDFTFTAASSTLTVQTQHHLTTSLTVTSVSGFSGTVTLACGQLPPYVTCELPQNAITLAPGSVVTVPLTFDTDAILNFAVFPALTLLILARKRRRQLFLGGALTLIAAFPLACGGHYPNSTPPGTYTVSLMASSATQTHTIAITLHVAP